VQVILPVIKHNTMNQNKIDIGNGKQAISLVPEIEGELAIVHLATIKRLAAMLPKANIDEIKCIFSEQILYAKTIEEFVSILETELAFHKSVNLITTYQPHDSVM
jgi:predicted ATPase with chaperone activity